MIVTRLKLDEVSYLNPGERRPAGSETVRLSPRQAAQAMGVSESSVKRWCDQGVIPTVRTAGGHRRIPLSAMLGFLRTGSQELVQPELLGLPEATGQRHWTLAAAAGAFREALVAGDETQCRQIALDLYLSGHRVSEIGDRIVAATFHEIGDLWACGDVEVYQERRGCEICMRLMHELSSVIPPAPPSAPLAIGGTPEQDHYSLPTAIIEIVLREAGWKAVSLGTCLPFGTMSAAIRAYQPRLFWLSVSHIQDPDYFLDSYHALPEAAGREVFLVLGGRALDSSIRPKLQFTAYCDDLAHLESLATSLLSR
jgi:excisionase family DNA binding protein